MALSVFPLAKYGPNYATPEVPIENLSGQDFSRGIDIGEKVPSVAGSIANAITGGVDAYQGARLKSAQIDQTEAAAQVEQQKIATPEEQALEDQKTQFQRDQLAQQTKTAQSRQELLTGIQTSVEQNPNDPNAGPQAMAEAISSGKYEDVFAADQHLYSQVLQQGLPFLSDTVQQSVLKKSQDNTYRNALERQAAGIQGHAQKADAEVLADTYLANMPLTTAQYGYTNPISIAEGYSTGHIAIDRHGTWQKDPKTGSVMRDDNTGLPVTRDVNPGSFVGGHVTYDLYDKDRGVLLGEDIPEATVKTIKARTQYHNQLQQLKGGFASPSEQVLNWRNKQAAQQNGSQQPSQLPTQPDPSFVGPKQPAPTSGVQFKQDTQQLGPGLVTSTGQPNISNNAAVPVLLGKSLGLNEDQIKEVSPDLEKLVNNTHRSILDSFENAVTLGLRGRLDHAADLHDAVNSVLSAKYKTDSGQPSDDDVAEHNKLAKKYNENDRYLPSFSQINDNTLLFKQLMADGTTAEVSSPEELFISRNYAQTLTQLQSRLDTLRSEVIKQSGAKAGSPETRQQLLAIIRPTK